jgi:L-ascorbate metabolism protein UlaG (beta-lactamase superfamily)
LGRGAIGLDAWSVTRLESPDRVALEVTATPCRHGPPLSRPLVGDVIGFALRPVDAGPDGSKAESRIEVPLWISGDTVLYDGVREVAKRLTVEVALLHLGGVRFPVSGPLRYTMTARDAVELCGSLRPGVAIPVHYEGWSHFAQGRDAIERELASAPAAVRDTFRWLPFGVPTDVAV